MLTRISIYLCGDFRDFISGKAAAYGSLCRLMIQKPEEKVPDGYYAAFYHAILKVNISNFFKSIPLPNIVHRVYIPTTTLLFNL